MGNSTSSRKGPQWTGNNTGRGAEEKPSPKSAGPYEGTVMSGGKKSKGGMKSK